MQVAFNPGVLVPFSHLGEDDEMRVQDSSCFAARGERVSFWELQVPPPTPHLVAGTITTTPCRGNPATDHSYFCDILNCSLVAVSVDATCHCRNSCMRHQ